MRYSKIIFSAASAIHVMLLYAATETIGPNVTIDTGEILDVIRIDDIETTGTVEVKNGGDSVFWSLTKVTLAPGFKASPNSSGYFQAAVDRDFDGRSDAEEDVDSDGDGILDGYEYEIIDFSQSDSIDLLSEVDGTGDFDGDGLTDSEEISGGTQLTFPDNYAAGLVVFSVEG